MVVLFLKGDNNLVKRDYAKEKYIVINFFTYRTYLAKTSEIDELFSPTKILDKLSYKSACNIVFRM